MLESRDGVACTIKRHSKDIKGHCVTIQTNRVDCCWQAEEEQQAADKAGKAALRRLALLESSSTAAGSTDIQSGQHQPASPPSIICIFCNIC